MLVTRPIKKRGNSYSMPKLRFGSTTIKLPGSRFVRIAIGAGLVLFGILGFLPILGFWMIPMGLVVLSVDLPAVRRWRRRLEVWWQRRVRDRRKKLHSE
jgi:hypothetical protein